MHYLTTSSHSRVSLLLGHPRPARIGSRGIRHCRLRREYPHWRLRYEHQRNISLHILLLCNSSRQSGLGLSSSTPQPTISTGTNLDHKCENSESQVRVDSTFLFLVRIPGMAVRVRHPLASNNARYKQFQQEGPSLYTTPEMHLSSSYRGLEFPDIANSSQLAHWQSSLDYSLLYSASGQWTSPPWKSSFGFGVPDSCLTKSSASTSKASACIL